MTGIRIFSKGLQSNKVEILGEIFTTPFNCEFTISVRNWAELKLIHPKWVNGGFLYPVNKEEEDDLLLNYKNSFFEKLKEMGAEQVNLTLSIKDQFTQYEIELARFWLAKEYQKTHERHEERQEDSLKISKRSNIIAVIALVVSVFSIVVSVVFNK
jgi:hypothetical protein